MTGWAGVAQYSGRCGLDCGTQIQVGDAITRGIHGFTHVTCPDAPDEAADAAALAQPRCGRCGLNHPGEC